MNTFGPNFQARVFPEGNERMNEYRSIDFILL